MQPTYVQRLRVTFRKFGPTRYIGHLDVARTWERALNRARVPMAYSQGFNKRPKMQFATATALGMTSDCERVDLWLTEPLEPAAAHEQIMSRMAPGIEVLSVEEVALKGDALQTLTLSTTILAVLPEEITADSTRLSTLREQVAEMMAAETLPRKRKQKKKIKRYDLRPLIHDLQVTTAAGGRPALLMTLALASSGTGRPDEVLLELGFDPLDCPLHRLTLDLAPESLAETAVPEAEEEENAG